MRRFINTTLILTAWFYLSSCNESPHIDFYSFQELSQYDFIRNGWFPDILQKDAVNIRETFDYNNKHVFGKFEFTHRPTYDSIFNSCLIVERDSLLKNIEKIKKPAYPKWFISKRDLNTNQYLVGKQKEFYLIMEVGKNCIYYFR